MYVKNKREYYNLEKKHLLGNTLRTWYGLDAYIASNCPCNVGFRSYNTNGLFIPKVDLEALQMLRLEGLDGIFSEKPDDSRLLLQGHIESDFSLYYSIEKNKTLREVENSLLCMHGLQSREVLKYHLTTASYEDLCELFELYPDSIIEFSVFDYCLGWAKGRNAIIWEVRNY